MLFVIYRYVGFLLVFGLIYICNPSLSCAQDIDISKIQNTRLGRNNDLRRDSGLDPYILDSGMNITAQSRSDYMAKLGYWTHARKKGDGYYNYKSVEDRFDKQGYSSGSHIENIGYGYISCSKNKDCSDKIIIAMQSVWNMYMKEKGKKYRPHYNSLVSKNMKAIGVGVSIKGSKYYITIHYTNRIDSQDSTKAVSDTRNSTRDIPNTSSQDEFYILSKK